MSQRRSTGSPAEKSPAKKRSRNPVKRFDHNEEVQKSARKRKLSGERDVLFEKGAYLAVRADRGYMLRIRFPYLYFNLFCVIENILFYKID